MNHGLVKINTALVSVTNKAGIDAFCRELQSVTPSLQLLATGNSAAQLLGAGCRIIHLPDYTGFPECFGGRVKTLHPKIEGGILYKRGEHEREAASLGIAPIDLVICNLYDFASVLQKEDAQLIELIESIDIGGSTLIRAAAKNFTHVAVVTDPADYFAVVQELHQHGGSLTIATRARLAAKAMNLSADYDAMIATEFSRRFCAEETLRPKLIKGRTLRYGENPDQKAWIYELEKETGIAQATLLNGKELSYNNYEDATVAYTAIQELIPLGTPHSAAVVKHGGICGYATAADQVTAFERAWAGDPKSAFGGVIALSSEVTVELISHIENRFIEVIIAPEFSPEFIDWATENKRSLRLLQASMSASPQLLFKKISGGMLVQTPKKAQSLTGIRPLFKRVSPQAKRKIGVVTELEPNPEQEGLVGFGMAAVKFAKSNAIAIVREVEPGAFQLLGIGAGQPNRVDSLERLAIPKAVENLREEHKDQPAYDPRTDLSKCLLASDGFFPFPDSIKIAAAAGFRTCIQPGGSIKDLDVIKAADDEKMCMIFSGDRSFSH